MIGPNTVHILSAISFSTPLMPPSLKASTKSNLERLPINPTNPPIIANIPGPSRLAKNPFPSLTESFTSSVFLSWSLPTFCIYASIKLPEALGESSVTATFDSFLRISRVSALPVFSVVFVSLLDART